MQKNCMKEFIGKLIKESISVKELVFKTQIDNIEIAATAIIESLNSGGKVIVFGNGGSAADSQHLAAELVGRFKKERRPLPAISLTTNTSTLTAIANDYSYDICFSRQLEALGRSGDIAIGISTSGGSKNILDAVAKAKSLGIKTIAIAGKDGGALAKMCDISIVVKSNDTARIQESHLTICHIICELIEKELFE